MPIMTFYWLRPKGSGFTKVAVGGLDRWPTDWVEIKLLLSEVMSKIYQDNEVAAATLLLERHLPGKKFMAFQSYRLNPFGYKRDFEGYFKVEYSHLSNEVWVPQAVFGFSLSFLTPGYLAMEKGRFIPRAPGLVPKAYQSLGTNVRHLLMEPSGLRYVDYTRKPRTAYHDVDEKYPHTLRYEREPRPVVEFQGRFEKVLPPTEQ